MSSNTPTEEPRHSTGGLPPIKVREKYVVEEAPSHDSTPCFTAWIRDEIVTVPEGWSSSDFSIADERPDWSIQIYDTTPQSNDPDHLKTLAETLHRETREERESYGRGEPDRIDLWGMPLATDVREDDRVAKCKAHFLAEIESRTATGLTGFPVPQLKFDTKWQRAIVLIDRPQELWNEGEGGFLAVYWDMRPDFRDLLKQEYGENHRDPETSVVRSTREELGQLLGGLRGDL